MPIIEPVKQPRTSDPKEIDKFFMGIAQRLSYISGSSNPVSAGVLPRWAGDWFYETTSGNWFKSTGLTAASWEQVTFAAGTLGDHGTLVGLSDDDHPQYIKNSLATAANDFLVASGVGAFIKKTLAEVKTIIGLGTAAYTALTDYAVAAKGVTNGDSHNHNGGDGAQIAHGDLSGIAPASSTHVTNGDSHDHSGGDGAQIAYSTLSGLPTYVNFVDRGDPAAADFTSFTTDSYWHDLDLSSIVPSGAKAVLLGLELLDDAAGSYFLVRKNGNSNAYNADKIRTQVANISMDGNLIVFVDANRVIEYRAAAVTFSSIEMVVRGWWI